MGRAFTTRRDAARGQIVAEVNRAFGIELGAEEFDGAPADVLAGRAAVAVKAVDDGRPLGRQALADLCKFLSVRLNLPPDAVRAETGLAGIFPDEWRLRRVWKELRSEFGKLIPALDYPRWADVLCAAAAVGAALLTLFWFPGWFGRHGPDWPVKTIGAERLAWVVFLAMVVAGLAAFWGVRWVFSPLIIRHVPGSCPTVGSLVPCAVARAEPAKGPDGKSIWTRELVEARVYKIIASAGNLPLTQVASAPTQCKL